MSLVLCMKGFDAVSFLSSDGKKMYTIKKCMKGNLRIMKNYTGMTLTVNGLLLNHIKPDVEKILRKNQNSFWRNQSLTSQIEMIC